MASNFMLVDGLAVAYRAFYGMRNLSTRSGKPTNAVFGFVKMMEQFDRRWSPTHSLVVFDGGLPRERLELLESYKAQRPPMPDDLKSQLPDIEHYLEASSVKWVREAGMEADDVIASLAITARNDGVDEVLLVTADKDFYQLVSPGISMVPVSGAEQVRVGIEQVRERCGVLPEQIADWLALTGDSADNIPGVPGIGPKTAAALLVEHGSLAGLWRGLGGVKNARIRQLLETNRTLVERNRQMTVLRTDCPPGVGWRDCERKAPSGEKLKELFECLEFHSLLRGLGKPAGAGGVQGELF